MKNQMLLHRKGVITRQGTKRQKMMVGELQPPSSQLTDPALPGRLVCASRPNAYHYTADQQQNQCKEN